MKKNSEKLAACGVFCEACPSFNKTCFGCIAEKKQKRKSKWGCKIRKCSLEKSEIGYCIYCGHFPCKIYKEKLLKNHRGDPRFNYRFEVLEQFPKMKKMGLENYIQYQEERYQCPYCGGKVHFYKYVCSDCGKKVQI